MGGDYYNNPVNCLTSDQNTYYKAFPYLFYTLNSYSGGFLWFDVENQTFSDGEEQYRCFRFAGRSGRRSVPLEPGNDGTDSGLWGKYPGCREALTVIRSLS